jgi:hypothetical protein
LVTQKSNTRLAVRGSAGVATCAMTLAVDSSRTMAAISNILLKPFLLGGTHFFSQATT